MDFVHPYQHPQPRTSPRSNDITMSSWLDLWSHNTGISFRRKSTKRKHADRPSTTPVTLTPSLDTSTGIIAIRYSSSDDANSTATSTPTTPQSSDSSDRSFFFDNSPAGEHSSQAVAVRPSLPKRSASRRTVVRPADSTASAVFAEQDRPMTPPHLQQAEVSDRPPIPAKSPYRASRAMLRMQGELVEMSEEQSQDTADEMR